MHLLTTKLHFFCGVRTYVHWCETGEKYWDTYFAPMLYCLA